MPGAETLGAIAVSAAGQVAGGAAASALMGDTSYPSGGGIEGLKNTDTGKSGIPSVVQMDPKPALEFFKKAADTYSTNAQQGLGYYNQALAAAQQQMTAGYSAANKTLQPISRAGTVATNQYLRMLGLDAPSPTEEYADKFREFGGEYGQIANQMKAAERLKDPAERAAAKQALTEQFSTLQQKQQQDFAAQKANALAQYNPDNIAFNARNAAGQFYDMDKASPDRNQIVKDAVAWQSALPNSQKLSYNPNDPLNIEAYYKAKLSNEYTANINNVNNQYATNTKGNNSQQLFESYIGNYQDKPDYLGYTGDEVNAQLEKTPGYQFSLKQGNSAIERSQAAKGMFNSGNTLKAMDDYSQGLAQQTYQQYMNNLLGIANTGINATGQISTNQANLGIGQANLTMGGGQAALNTFTGIGQAYYNALSNQGNTYTQIQQGNMAAQNQAILGAYDQSNANARAGMGAGVGLAGQAYQQQQGQQAVQGFNAYNRLNV